MTDQPPASYHMVVTQVVNNKIEEAHRVWPDEDYRMSDAAMLEHNAQILDRMLLEGYGRVQADRTWTCERVEWPLWH